MVKLRGALVVAALCLAFAGTVKSQQCDRLTTPQGLECDTGCVVFVRGCAYGSGDCYYIFPGVQCPCDINEYWANAESNPSVCGQLVRPTAHASFKTAVGTVRSFVVYLPNCKGSLSVEEVVS